MGFEKNKFLIQTTNSNGGLFWEACVTQNSVFYVFATINRDGGEQEEDAKSLNILKSRGELTL